jgi:1-deoxy-D-xylulose-5-phosphate reductoisomerase
MVEQTMNKISFLPNPTLEEYFDSDAEARNFAASMIQM